MDAPGALPRTADDRAAWLVYADWLQGSSDAAQRRHGRLIAYDLSLGADATPAQAERYRALAGHACAPRWIGWALGFARGIHVGWHSREAAIEVMRGPRGRFLEEIELETCTYADPLWRAVLAAIPPTCTRAVLRQAGKTFGDLDALPASIVELGQRTHKGQPWPLGFSSRFAVADLTHCRLQYYRDEVVPWLPGATRVLVTDWPEPRPPNVEVVPKRYTIRERGLVPWALQ